MFSHVAMVFQLYVSNVSSVLDVCCKCFIWILQKWTGLLYGTAGGCHCVGHGVGIGPYDGCGHGWWGARRRTRWGRMQTRERRMCRRSVQTVGVSCFDCLFLRCSALCNWHYKNAYFSRVCVYGCVHFAKSSWKVTVASFVVIRQNLSNYGLTRLKRFVPIFTDKLCN
jgi:hypothetical protein